MELKILVIFLLSTIQFGFGSKFIEQDTEKYVFYLHSNIIEIQAKNAYSEAFGKYEFDAIISAIKPKMLLFILK